MFNINKAKEQKTHTPVSISGAEVEQMSSFRILRISITESLSWPSHVSTLVKRVQKKMYFLRKLTKAKFWCQVLLNFYRGAGESVLTGNITNWDEVCMAQDRRAP